jgi:hypothetical protein
MRSKIQALCGVTILFVVAFTRPSDVAGANAYPLITDPDTGGLAFGALDIFSFGANYMIDDAAQLNGNEVLSISQSGLVAGGTGAGMSLPISNGENGIEGSLDGANNDILNDDPPNGTPANSVFTAIGNPSGKLENGNVIRYSAWFRSDPANPITVDPQIQPVLKFELWKQALSGNQDTNGGQVQPLFGDKVFDQDQHGGTLNIAAVDKAQWIDIDGDGMVIDASAGAEGRTSSISTAAWTLVETTYTVNDTDWLGIADDVYDVGDLEEIRAVLFLGDFGSTDLSGDGDGGNLLVDNLLVEVFRNAAAVTPNTNPDPGAAPAGLAGDYNQNNAVDAADYALWRDRNGTATSLPNDDTAGVGPDDYTRWRANFGRTSTGGSALATAAVPEPAGVVSVLCYIVAAASFRRSPKTRAML